MKKYAAVMFIHAGLEGMEGAMKEPRPLPSPIADWTNETTRTATHLITTDTLLNHGKCKIILSHGGGTFPYIAQLHI